MQTKKEYKFFWHNPLQDRSAVHFPPSTPLHNPDAPRCFRCKIDSRSLPYSHALATTNALRTLSRALDRAISAQSWRARGSGPLDRPVALIYPSPVRCRNAPR